MAKGRKRKITRARRANDTNPSGRSRYALKGGAYKYSFATGEAYLAERQRGDRGAAKAADE